MSMTIENSLSRVMDICSARLGEALRLSALGGIRIFDVTYCLVDCLQKG
jgi:hypothetical protein